MKYENFNINLKTLDDQALYREICKKIREMEAVSFKLFWTVPLISVILMLLLWFDFMTVPPVITVMAGIFGALITYFIFCWEKQNMQIHDIFRKHAALLEKRKNRQEKHADQDLGAGPYTLIDKMIRPELFGEPANFNQKGKYVLSKGNEIRVKRRSGLGKGRAEKAVYLLTIILWLMTVILGFVRIYQPEYLGNG